MDCALPGHHYRKLVPFAGDTSEADMEEGEGALAARLQQPDAPQSMSESARPVPPCSLPPRGGVDGFSWKPLFQSPVNFEILVFTLVAVLDGRAA